jgi:hypothetical protein
VSTVFRATGIGPPNSGGGVVARVLAGADTTGVGRTEETGIAGRYTGASDRSRWSAGDRRAGSDGGNARPAVVVATGATLCRSLGRMGDGMVGLPGSRR